MCYVKEIKANYENESDVYNVINYIANMEKSIHLISGGNGIIAAENIHCISSEYIARQFLAVQRKKTYRGRRVYHVVASLDKIIDDVPVERIKYIAEEVIRHYWGYQSVYAVHEDTYNLHIHFIFNNISINNYKNLSVYFNVLDIKELIEVGIDKYKRYL